MAVIRSFGRYSVGDSIVRNATSLDDVRSAFSEATSAGMRIVIRGGGHSFHDQALHRGDTGQSIVLRVSDIQSNMIEFAPDGSQVTLGAGVRWGDYFRIARDRAASAAEPLRIPASLQTGRKATVGGTLSGDCLSRFSGTMGKESRSVVSFRLLTTSGDLLDVTETNNRDLFHAVIGGHGYFGFVSDATYRLVPVTLPSVAHTAITLHDSFSELIRRQIEAVTLHAHELRAISAVWFTDLLGIGGPSRIKGCVFESWLAAPSIPPQPGFPIYSDIDSEARYASEVLARTEPANTLGHEILYQLAKHHDGNFENDLADFFFFMDGNTVAKERFERLTGQLFPIIQQTFVVPTTAAAEFAANCEWKMRSHALRPTESDMLYVASDECLMSANYHLDGFAISFAFEPLNDQPPQRILALLDDLSRDCVAVGGRLHLVKNVHADKQTLEQMFTPQIRDFEALKRRYDPNLILQNTFSDRLFTF